MKNICKYCKQIKNKKNKKYCSRKCLYQDMIGHKVSDKVREKFSKYSKSKVPWNKNKKNIQQSGENHWHWRGGVTGERKKSMNTFEYKEWRKSIFERDNYTCILCGDNRGGNLEADHIKPWIAYPELRLDIDNGRTLCHDCHKKTDTYGYVNKKKYETI